MNKVLVWGFGLLILGAALVGCGSSTSTDTTTTTATVTTTTSTTSTTLVPGATVSISGTLNSGIITSARARAAGLKTQAVAYAALDSYTVAAVSKDTGTIYFASAETDATGAFMITDLPATDSYYIEILDDSKRLAAPVAFGVTNEGAAMAVAPGAADLSLGSVVYESAKGAAAPVTAPSDTKLDAGSTVEAKSGETLVPKGAGSYGKGSEAEYSGSYDITVMDGDKDGIPNFFDADNNGDGVIDELDGLYTAESFILGTPPDVYVYAFTNLKVDYSQRDTFQTDYNTFSLAIGLVPNKMTSAKTVASVEVTDGPAWINSAKLAGTSTLWSAIGHYLPPRDANAYEVQLNQIKPLTDVNAGDTLTYKVIYTDGSSEEVVKMLNFVFTDIPRLTYYKVANGGWLPAPASLPTSISSSEISLIWTRPKDEDGHEIIGGRYTWEYNAIGGGAQETTIITRDADASATSLEGSCNLIDLPNILIQDNPGTNLVGICIRSVANDNSAENLWFLKGW